MTCYKGYYDLVDAGYRTESQVETRAAQVERELRQLLEERRREQMG